jgi:hypothetical protein
MYLRTGIVVQITVDYMVYCTYDKKERSSRGAYGAPLTHAREYEKEVHELRTVFSGMCRERGICFYCVLSQKAHDHANGTALALRGTSTRSNWLVSVFRNHQFHE